VAALSNSLILKLITFRLDFILTGFGIAYNIPPPFFELPATVCWS